ncbi:hypothetical protein PEBR_38220 [Penicillium brasilianum]|uniref:Uncharacterized protein n=1 Tax=Penicillium brasilianum TaxID=104259 RepID=A0A1S9RC83_PENBI|nr:hypothetical protein PEBR_38220 [Penicillium brasilianum]
MFLKNCWALLVVPCVLFASAPVRGEGIVIAERDINAALGQGVNSDLTGAMLMARQLGDPTSNRDGTTRGSLTTTVTLSTCPTSTSQSLSTAICDIATALCAACPPSVVTITSTATITIGSAPPATVTRTVTECPGPITTSTSTSSSRPLSSSATPTPSSSIRPRSSSIIPSSSSVIPSRSSGRPSTTATSVTTTHGSTPLGRSFSSPISPRTTTSSTLLTHPTSTETVRTISPRGGGTTTTTRRNPPGIVRREMMGNITARVTNTTRTFANATTSGPLNLTAIRTETTTTTTGVFPRFQRIRYRY